MKKILLVITIIAIGHISMAQNFKIDAEHTAVTSKVQRFGMVDVLGRFNKVDGTITYNTDPTKISADVTIAADSYSSNNKGGEDAVKGPAFLNVASYPEIKFQSQSVEKRGNDLWMKGQLTIHGKTNSVEFPFSLIEPAKDPTGLNTLAVFASIKINRQDYGIAFSRKLPNGKDVIGNEVTIELNVLAAQ